MTRLVRATLAISLVALGASWQAVGPHPLIVLATIVAVICSLFSDESWTIGEAR